MQTQRNKKTDKQKTTDKVVKLNRTKVMVILNINWLKTS